MTMHSAEQEVKKVVGNLKEICKCTSLENFQCSSEICSNVLQGYCTLAIVASTVKPLLTRMW